MLIILPRSPQILCAKRLGRLSSGTTSRAWAKDLTPLWMSINFRHDCQGSQIFCRSSFSFLSWILSQLTESVPFVHANHAHRYAIGNALHKLLFCARQATDKVENAVVQEYFTTAGLEAVCFATFLQPPPTFLQTPYKFSLIPKP